MSAAALPVCLTRPPKLVLHPPPVSKSDIKPVPGLGHCCRKTTKKQARKGEHETTSVLLMTSFFKSLTSRNKRERETFAVDLTVHHQPLRMRVSFCHLSVSIISSVHHSSLLPAGKTPEEVVKKYLQKVKSPPEEV